MTSYWKGLRSELLKVPSVSVPGWGTFRRVELKPRVVHPVKGSGKDLFVPTALSVRFRLASKMKKFLNKKGRSSR
jgi:nucleoid DNA-binding protein